MDSEHAARISELRDLIAEQSIRHGQFTLASGARSSYYCDTRATTLSPRGAKLVGEILFDLIEARGAEAVGGLALGATFIATAVALVSSERGRPIYAFTVRDAQKGHGMKKSVEESYHPDGQPLLRPGRAVAIVDDVVTEGGSALKAAEVVREKGCRIVSVIAIVDRGAGGGEKLRAEGLPYTYLFRTDAEGGLHLGEAAGATTSARSAKPGSAPSKPAAPRPAV